MYGVDLRLSLLNFALDTDNITFQRELDSLKVPVFHILQTLVTLLILAVRQLSC